MNLTAYLSVFDLFLAQWIMAIFSKGCKLNNFESHNSLKFSFMYIWGLRSIFVECECFFESNSSDILALYETDLDDSIGSGNFSVRGYLLPLIWKNCVTHMHGLAVYVKEGLPFARGLSLENLLILVYVFDWLYFTQCVPSISFFLLLHLTQMSLSWSTHLLMSLSLETLTSIIMTG